MADITAEVTVSVYKVVVVKRYWAERDRLTEYLYDHTRIECGFDFPNGEEALVLKTTTNGLSDQSLRNLERRALDLAEYQAERLVSGLFAVTPAVYGTRDEAFEAVGKIAL